MSVARLGGLLALDGVIYPGYIHLLVSKITPCMDSISAAFVALIERAGLTWPALDADL